MRFLKLLPSFLIVFLLFIIPAGCGSGGGGGGGSASGGGLTYAGSTSSAVITSDNAIGISTGSYNGGGSSSLPVMLGARNVRDRRQLNSSLVVIISKTLQKAVLEADTISLSGQAASGAVESRSYTENGDCGGRLSYTVNINDNNGDFNATYNFNSFCTEGTTLSGIINYSGRISMYTGRIDYVRASFNTIDVACECGSYTMQGNIDYDFGWDSMTANLNVLVRDNGTGKVYKVENYTVVITDAGTYLELDISGVYYDPDHGYVTVSTDTPLRRYNGDPSPSQGVMIVTGNTGIAGGSTKARFTVISTTAYAVEADTDGDGSYDWSRILDWDDGSDSEGRLDTEAPEVPDGLTVNAISDSEISISWNMSKDNVGVSGYKIYKNGKYLKTVNDLSITDFVLDPFIRSCYRLAAIDAAGNESPHSNEVCDIELFVDSGQELIENATAVALGDLDGDGDNDAFITSGACKVLLNNGNGVFIDSGRSMGISGSVAVSLGDLDGDGDLDAFVVNHGNYDAVEVWVNRGDGVFSYIFQNIGYGWSGGKSVALGDLDGDGDLDALVGDYNQNKVLINNGEGFFSDSGQTLGYNAVEVALGDLDGDGDNDAYIANYQAPHKVWINDGEGIFTDSGQNIGWALTFDVALGDLDDDGDLDVFVANYNESNNVWINDGNGEFSDSGQNLGSSKSNGVSLGDLDGDGDLDAFVANGEPYYSRPNGVWLNDGSGIFSTSLHIGGLDSRYVALGDLDGDSDLDAFIINKGRISIPQPNKIWINTSP